MTFTDKPIDRLAIGVGMIPRGEVGLVLAVGWFDKVWYYISLNIDFEKCCEGLI